MLLLSTASLTNLLSLHNRSQRPALEKRSILNPFAISKPFVERALVSTQAGGEIGSIRISKLPATYTYESFSARCSARDPVSECAHSLDRSSVVSRKEIGAKVCGS